MRRCPGTFCSWGTPAGSAGGTPVRAAFWSGAFVEGWAVYAEELMAGHGYPGEGDPDAVRMQQLKMRLRMIINTILDVRVHCLGWPEAEAMALMTGRGFQEDGEAAGKWRRALLTSAQLSTYYVGYTEVSDLAAGCGRLSPGVERAPAARRAAGPRLPSRAAPAFSAAQLTAAPHPAAASPRPPIAAGLPILVVYAEDRRGGPRWGPPRMLLNSVAGRDRLEHVVERVAAEAERGDRLAQPDPEVVVGDVVVGDDHGDRRCRRRTPARPWSCQGP